MLEWFESLYLFLWSILSRSWYILILIFLDFFDLWNRIIKRILPRKFQLKLKLPTPWVWVVLALVIAWAAFDTYHDLRMRTINTLDDYSQLAFIVEPVHRDVRLRWEDKELFPSEKDSNPFLLRIGNISGQDLLKVKVSFVVKFDGLEEMVLESDAFPKAQKKADQTQTRKLHT